MSELYTPLGLIIVLTSDRLHSRREITNKLTSLLRAEHSSLIIKLLSDSDYRVRAMLAEVLEKRPDLNLSEHLLKLADDNVAFVRGSAIHAIGRLGIESARGSLLAHQNDKEKISNDSKERVCDYSAIALVKLERRIPMTILDNLRVNPSFISHELIQMNRFLPLMVENEFVNELTEILLTPNIPKNLSTGIINLIGEFGSAKDAHTLLDYLASGRGDWSQISWKAEKLADKTIKSKALSLLDVNNKGLRMACLDILKTYGDDTVINKVLGLLDQKEDDYVILRAIHVLAAHGDVSLLDKISSFRDSEEDSIRASVVQAYGKLRDEASLTRIMPFLDDRAYVVRAAAVRALIDLDNSENFEIILNQTDIWASSGDDYFKDWYNVACLEAIGKFGNEEHWTMVREVALKHRDADCRVAAIYALNALSDRNIVDLLINKLSDEEYAFQYDDTVCHIAARILSTIDQEKAKNALEEWLLKLPQDKKLDFTRDL